ncbi:MULTISPECIES: DUF4303 domain-containing protein [Bacteroides]|jgi:hypothetical protein|uniref:DUF4303 domain-containing protein n=1 Tax=Bacteroides TaxID=816 RepID=UPI002330DE77|nr:MULTISPECIES: DUF4303 domain-containing protein [Bacteroides]MDC2304073.1 DUF4303 domain-containing protein [Bacteroides stercoris]MDC2762670.1 DUF4303 domain-containing protein [Bacteroides ovatus]MDC2767697.1 DUF4303 domain-containing protein [Bacteroides ovatus]MDC2776953.1 DUF4303 domain-containing protein [Bacteroides ovatus]
METGLSKKKIKESIIKMHNYLKTQDYYEDINSYALYTDDGYMSITMIFNTNSYLDKKKDDKYYLTYKYSPAEWYSEILKSDSLIYGNTFFDEISCFLKERALSGGDNEKNVIDDCIEALKDIRNRGEITHDKILLFMVSDCYDEEAIIKWNSKLNTLDIANEIKKWLSD